MGGGGILGHDVEDFQRGNREGGKGSKSRVGTHASVCTPSWGSGIFLNRLNKSYM